MISSFTHSSVTATQHQHQPRKTVTTQAFLSSATYRISPLASSICFLHLKIPIVRIIQAQFSSTVALLSLFLILWNWKGASLYLQDRPLNLPGLSKTHNKSPPYASLRKCQNWQHDSKIKKRRGGGGSLYALLIHIKKKPHYCRFLCSTKEESSIVTQSAKQFLYHQNRNML